MKTKNIKNFKELKIGNLIKYNWPEDDTLEIVVKIYQNICVSYVIRHSNKYEEGKILETTDINSIIKIV